MLKKTKAISLVLALILILCVLPPQAFMAGETIYSGDGFEIQYKVTSKWSGAQNLQMTLKNTGSSAIQNWAVGFYAPGAAESPWSAVVGTGSEGYCVIENAGWNAKISAGGSVTFGFTLKTDETFNPEKFYIGDEARNPPVTPTDPDDPIIDWDNLDENDDDNDGLPNWMEDLLGTDKNNPDTDGDGMPDGYEVQMGTDPLVPDGDLDSDEDGLSNLEEYTLETDPQNPDTDDDGLSDYDEGYTYNTDPLNPDTDGDGLWDGEEVTLGLDPLNPKTDGITSDGERVFEQTVSADSDILTSVNTEDNPYQLSLEITSSGFAQSRLSVSESGLSSALQNESVVGGIIDIAYDDGFEMEKAVLQFTINEEIVDSGSPAISELELSGIRRYNVFVYLEEMNILAPVETFHDEGKNIAYANIDQNGVYCIVDMAEWFELLEVSNEPSDIEPASAQPPRQNPLMASGEPLPLPSPSPALITPDISDLLPRSISPAELPVTPKAVTAERVVYNGHMYAVFDESCTWTEARARCGALGGHLVTISDANEQNFVYTLAKTVGKKSVYWLGGTDQNKEGQWEWVTGEPWSYSNWMSGEPNNWRAADGYENYLGMFMQWSWNDFSNGGSNEPLNNFGYICEWDFVPQSDRGYTLAHSLKRVTLDKPLQKNGTTDSDGDGLTDYKEVTEYLIQWNTDGSVKKLPTLGDAYMYISVSAYARFPKEMVAKMLNTKVLPVKSDPREKDSDGDGLGDKDDPRPLKAATVMKFVEKVKELEAAINKRVWMSSGSAVPNKVLNRYAINILRCAGGYAGLSWSQTSGDENGIVRASIDASNPEIISYFKNNTTLLDYNGEEIDFLHMMATMSAYYYTSIFPFDDAIIDDLAGWGADLQSFIKNLKIGTNGSQDINILKKYSYANMFTKGTLFDKDDLHADVDAFNVYQIYGSGKILSDAMTSYYKGQSKDRYRTFVSKQGGIFNLKARATYYTYGDNLVYHRKLNEYATAAYKKSPSVISKDVSQNESEALVHGFISCLEELYSGDIIL